MITPDQFLRRSLAVLGLFLLIFSARSLPAAPPDAEILLPGYRPVPPGVHALVGAKVFIKPGQVLDNATIIIRDGFIESVSKDAAPPAAARVWDMKGLTIYAGFIDPYLVLGHKSDDKSGKSGADDEPESADTDNLRSGGGINFFGAPAQAREPGDNTGPGYEVARVVPEHRMAQTFSPDPKALEKLREIGFTAGNIVPEKGIIRGTSAFVALSDVEPNRTIIRPDVFQHIALDAERQGRGAAYPASLMGVIAVVRQSFFDAQHYVLDQADFRNHPQGRTRPRYNISLEALGLVSEKKMPVIFAVQEALMVDRAARMAHELNLDFYLLSSGQEWRRPDLAKAAGVPFIVPLNFPTLPKMPLEEDWQQASLDQLRAWDWAPENAAVLQNQGLEVALTTFGLGDKKDFRKNLRLAVDRGLSETNALAALTTVPARLCGLDSLLGTIEPGKQANLTVVDGKGYFDPEAKVRAVWIDGRIYRVPTEDKDKDETVAKADEKESATKPSTPEQGDPNKSKPESGKKKDSTEIAKDEKSNAEKKQAEKEVKLAKMKELQKRVAHAPLEGRGVLTNPPTLLLRNATLWTCGPDGVVSNVDLLVEDGKIKKIGPHLVMTGSSPGQPLAIDCTGEHVTPGLIDCHSHSMILGGVNEGTLPSSAMVRIGDVVNSEAVTIYNELAGGLTIANLLHGSANPIGGQTCVIKLRDGETPEGLKFASAPGGIKFALGENVKQSNWGDRVTTRFPQTRMGVRAFYANRFIAAQQYLQEWADFKKSGGLAPRRDLELEAIGEILRGERLIHCHSYRQDEILMLIHLMDDFGVKIGTFQHVLEGYKVADEIAKHGAGASTFADWWAYKFEVYDGIPYNAGLMRERGVIVSVNSDSDDLARRLNLEAAKSVKFGGTPEAEALKFVTLNPAIQLHIDKWVGSLEPGKDADFVIWSKAPLDSSTVCLSTWIEGREYFNSGRASARAAALAQERTDLLAKAKKLSTLSEGGGGGESGPSTSSFFDVSLEHLYDGINRHCLDDE